MPSPPQVLAVLPQAVPGVRVAPWEPPHAWGHALQMLGRRWAQGLGAKETVPACLPCPLDCPRLQAGGSEWAEKRCGPHDLFLGEFGVLSVRSVDPGPGACGADSPVWPPAHLSCRRRRCPACGRTSPFSRNRRFLILPFTLFFHDREFHECSDSNVNKLPSSDRTLDCFPLILESESCFFTGAAFVAPTPYPQGPPCPCQSLG